jgi:hypothetical protein
MRNRALMKGIEKHDGGDLDELNSINTRYLK